MNIEIKKVAKNGPMNDFIKNLLSLFTTLLVYPTNTAVNIHI